jgi:hypothetical protein
VIALALGFGVMALAWQDRRNLLAWKAVSAALDDIGKKARQKSSTWQSQGSIC